MTSRVQIQTSLRALLGKWAGDRAGPPPEPPAGLPASVQPLVRDAVAALVDYQGVTHARLYLHRLRRFIGRRDIDDAMFAAIARRMLERMTYDDPVRLAQLTLAETSGAEPGSVRRHCRFRFEEMIEPLPAAVSRPAVAALARLGWSHRMVTRRYSAHSPLARGRLRFEAGLRRWRALGHCHERERLWVERWLHMIDRALAHHPDAAQAIVDSATMMRGYGDDYRRGLAAWHLIIDGLAKPVFDGTLVLPDLAGALAAARKAAEHDDADLAQLREVIAEARATCNLPQAVS